MLKSVRGGMFFLLMTLCLAAGVSNAEAGYAHFIYDATNKKVLASENADELNHPASLTKMMTLYLTFETLRAGKIRWDDTVMMTPNAASKSPTKLGLPAGQTITVREAVLAMIVRSANDAAAAMGDFLGGDEERFAGVMTARARQLGMNGTVFRNASGLPDDAQVTTAHDMAVLSLALVQNFPKEYALFSSPNMEFRGKRLRGHNNLMYRYPGMDGIKTGFTNASGFNIASAVTVDGRRIIGVVMGGKTARKRDDQMAALLDQFVRPSAPSGDAMAAVDRAKRPAGGQMTVDASGQPLAFAGSGAGSGAGSNARQQVLLGANAPARPATTNLYAAPQQPVGPIWRIQIAAGASRDQASATLNKAIPMLSAFQHLAPSVESYADGKQELFRARIVGFADKQVAAQACAQLQSKSFNCFVVQ
ncbi:MAG: D-alanyl-D-alanine carboxypeptidase [Neorhizobium sp.]|nr:D-alanyl-D-alanine carboxypeptidase [Neorhizobium sp.]